jgi:hypothetical protein
MTIPTGVGRGFGGGSRVCWTAAQDARIRELAAQGLTTAEAAAVLGVSKNQIIGRGRRMRPPVQWEHKPFGRPGPRPRRKPGAPPRSRRKKSGNCLPMPEPDPIPEAPPPSLNVVVLDLRKHHCRYPYGERSPYLFCGAEPLKGSSYCAFHRAMTCDPRPRAEPTLPPTIRDA